MVSAIILNGVMLPVGKNQWLFHFKGANLIEPYRLTTQWWKRPPVRLQTSVFDPNAIEYWNNRSKQMVWINP